VNQLAGAVQPPPAATAGTEPATRKSANTTKVAQTPGHDRSAMA
jgi:hypothetical protein